MYIFETPNNTFRKYPLQNSLQLYDTTVLLNSHLSLLNHDCMFKGFVPHLTVTFYNGMKIEFIWPPHEETAWPRLLTPYIYAKCNRPVHKGTFIK